MVIGSYQMTNFQLEEIPPGLIDHREWTPDNGPNNALDVYKRQGVVVSAVLIVSGIIVYLLFLIAAYKNRVKKQLDIGMRCV